MSSVSNQKVQNLSRSPLADFLTDKKVGQKAAMSVGPALRKVAKELKKLEKIE